MTDANPPEPNALVSRSIGTYRIEEELGAGAMGTVFRAIHTGLERAVALKVLRPDLLQDPDSIRRFLREARSIARLEHPHIVSVYDAGEADGMHYIAMKLLEGGTLQSALAREGSLSIDRTVRIALQLASALDYAHSQAVVHLDVKPANVMIESGDKVILTDFSIARAINPEATRSATISGTPLYMSPEQIQGNNVDSRSDLYSLGLLIYEMCVGRPPFQGQFVTVMYAHLHAPVPDMREQIPNVPHELVSIVSRALQKNPVDRYQSARDMAIALQGQLPPGETDPGATIALDGRDQELKAAIRLQSGNAAEAAPTITRGQPRMWPRVTSSVWKRYGVPVALVLVLAAVVGAVVALRGQSSNVPGVGTLSILSSPSGAQILLDGKSRGSSPLTLPSIKVGTHHISLSLPTYKPVSLDVTVDGGKTVSLHPTLPSWPMKQLLSVTQHFLVDALTVTGPQNHVALGNAVVTIHRADIQRANGKKIFLASVIERSPSAQARASIVFTPRYELYDSNHLLVGTVPNGSQPYTLTGTRTKALVTGGLLIHAASNRNPPLGQWEVRLLANDEQLYLFHFQVAL